MANIAALLKDEISRLSRREVRRQTGAMKKASAAHRRAIAAMKRQIAKLERLVGQLGKRAARGGSAAPASSADDAAGTRFVAKGLRSHRTRMGLSAAEFAKLIGVSAQSVYNWEHKKSTPRKSQIAAIAALRGLGKREARARLEGSGKPAAAAKRGRRKTAGKRGRPRKAA